MKNLSVYITILLFCFSGYAWTQFSQQGENLEPRDTAGVVNFGSSCALSADGNTAIIGAAGFFTEEGFDSGGAYIFTRSNNQWNQQGNKLFGTGGIGPTMQGLNVAISADGNTTIVGGEDNYLTHAAAWVFIRSNGKWIQQAKLQDSTALGGIEPLAAVAISADGNTAVLGGNEEDSTFTDTSAGALWVFIRSNGIWTQQGPKLVGKGAIGPAQQGSTVAISADGSTIAEGGPSDSIHAGAVWVFTRTNGTWTQQGEKFAGANSSARTIQGSAVALSADGNTLAIGCLLAVRVFTRTNGLWSQQGKDLSSFGFDHFGLSEDGNLLAVRDTVLSKNGSIILFKRTNAIWERQANSLIGKDQSLTISNRIYITMSSDGNTIMESQADDRLRKGTAWVFFNPSGVVSVKDNKLIPQEFTLKQNYPNPFNPSTIITYQIPDNQKVSLKIYDILGREVRTLVSEDKPAGKYSIEFISDNLPSGVYVYELRTDRFLSQKKMMIIK